MDAMGKDYIIIETVGVGQDEVDIAKSAHVTVIVVVPGMGDHIQAIKAGILRSVGDIFVINKADRPDAERTFTDLKAMFDIARKRLRRKDWEPPILMAEAVSNKGVVELLREIERFRKSRKALSHETIIRERQAAARLELVDMIKKQARGRGPRPHNGEPRVHRAASIPSSPERKTPIPRAMSCSRRSSTLSAQRIVTDRIKCPDYGHGFPRAISPVTGYGDIEDENRTIGP